MTTAKISVLTAVLITLGPTACIDDSALDSDYDSVHQQFRYIPSYTNACEPGDKPTYLAVRNHLAQVSADYHWRVASTMEMCDENSCAPCSAQQNPMLEILRSSDQWGSEDLNAAFTLLGGDFTDPSNLVASPLEVYFAEALAYPWRQLLLGTPTGEFGATTLVLAQGIHRPCDDGTLGCDDFRVAIESLSQTCDSLAVSLPVHLDPGGELTALGSSAAGLGFQVPLTADLPPPSSFQSVPELEQWLEGTPHLTVEMSDVEIDWSVSAGGSRCATVRGHVDADIFDSISDTPTSVDSYADESGRIPTVLSLQLGPAAVIPG